MNTDTFYNKLKGYHILYSGEKGTLLKIFNYDSSRNSGLIDEMHVQKFIPNSILLITEHSVTFVTKNDSNRIIDEELVKLFNWSAKENETVFRTELNILKEKTFKDIDDINKIKSNGFKPS